jgi:GT2 family glycosyltransferase
MNRPHSNLQGRVCVVIPVHNGIEHTLPLCRALIPLLHPADRIVVVDDGSSDGTTELLREELPEVVVLRGDGQLWWSGAINMGARFALDQGAQYVLMMNNDVILHPQFLDELLIGAQRFPHAIIASKILSADEPWKVWSMGGRVDWPRGKFWMLGCGAMDDGRWESPTDVDWLPGMSVLTPVEVFRRGVWVDKRYFPQYFGDSDFTMRAKKAGFRLVVWPKSRIYNKVGNTGLDTRLVLGLERLTPGKFLQSLTSFKSSRNVRVFWAWTRRHAPVWTWPITLGRYYGYYLAKTISMKIMPGRMPRRLYPFRLEKVAFRNYQTLE